MRLLAIETATDACSAALLWDGEVRLRYQVQPRGHSELILGMMDELLAEAGIRPQALDAIAFGRGPGSFTGVRIAVGVAQGAAFGAGLPLVPVSTLAALAQRAFREHQEPRLLPAYDARMHEVYWAGYEVGNQGLVEVRVAEEVAAPDAVSLPPMGSWCGVGSGWRSYAEVLSRRVGTPHIHRVLPDLLCSAEDVARLGAAAWQRGLAVPPEQGLPVYLRNRVVARPGPRGGAPGNDSA
jgi:tRNA threonylcarbamoyladenosine biosynthesis protein TsaB